MSQDLLEVITTDQFELWNEILRDIGIYCFYNLASFHRLSELRGQGRAEMLVFRDGGYTIIYPMLVREIDIPNVISAADGLKDATCVPGLAGPLASSPSVPEDIRQRFISTLQVYFEDNRIVTAYCRLNCLLDQQPLFDGYGRTVTHGVEISVDLTIPEEEQFARYRSDHRRSVRRLARKGFICEEVGIEYLDEFIRIYNDTMDRKNAEPAFYFDRAFFEYLMNDMSDVSHLFICKDGERITTAGMYLMCNGIIHSYLSGTEGDYVKLSPSKLLTDVVRRWAVERGCRMFHMGAGDHTQRDSLWDFKVSFGGREHEYSTWRHIVDSKLYESICQRVFESAGAVPDGSFFPAYRDPAVGKSSINEVQTNWKF